MSSQAGSIPRLKSFEMQGYKTFAYKTTLELASKITAVVGPNGSGKSNIADAIRWVLGEQAYSLLRGKRTEDMIFSGSEERARAGMASATIAFDNSDGWLPIDFTEVTVSRRAYRDGQNEYYLNAQKVRLRDITELLSQSGLAERTYTVIGQGLVDAALSLKAEERRELFEEAAGIGLYRSRREEALRRLDRTRRNLERVRDILGELKPRLRRLERQASRARTYRQVKEDLHGALRIWYGYHWYHMLETIAQARRGADKAAQARASLQERQAQNQETLSGTRHQIDHLRDQLHGWSQTISERYAQRETLGRNLAVAEERLRAVDEQMALVQTEIESLEQAHAEMDSRLGHARDDVGERLRELAQAQASVRELQTAGEVDLDSRRRALARMQEAQRSLEELVGRRASWGAEIRHLETEIENLQPELEAAVGELQEKQEEAERVDARSARACSALEEAKEARAQARREQAELEARLERLRYERGLEQERIPSLHAAVARAESRLEELQKASAGSQYVLKAIREAAESGQVSSFLGQLLDQIQVEPRYQRAVIAALGEFANGLALQTLHDIEAALDRIDSHKQGVAVLLPLEPLTETSSLPDPETEASLGVAAQFVQAPPAYHAILDHLLGRTLVARDRVSARRLLPGLPSDARVVTLQGELLFPSGAVITGAAGTEQKRVISEEELREALKQAQDLLEEARGREGLLFEEVAGAEASLETVRSESERASEEGQGARLRLGRLEQEAAEVQREVRRIEGERTVHQLKLERAQEHLERLQAQKAELVQEREQCEAALQRAIASTEQAAPSLAMTRAEARVEVAERAHADAQRRVDEFEGRSSALSSDLQAWGRRLEGLQSEKADLPAQIEQVKAELDAIEGKIKALRENVEPAEEVLRQAEKRRAELEGQESELRSEFRSMEQEHSQAQILLARRQEEMVGLRRRIEDDFGLIALEMDADVPGQAPLPLEGLVERLPHVETLPHDLESQVNHLRAQLRRIGSVNLEAQREYDEVSERVAFLTRQVDDLRRAETQIQEIIAELDLLMEREFRKTFDAVAVAFRKAFKRLFGGGSAHLVLSDPDDLTNTGIDIEARLPGRREQGLAMLSGGERSLTASALIFALLEVSPTPFCVLDEVDAMLDEANVLRFTEMLRELSRQTQFIVITHNRLTVQAADVIYGVSMEADSISRVISLRLDEAERELAA